LKSSVLAKCFAEVLPSRLREHGEMGTFGRLWVHRFRKESKKASEDLWGMFRGKMPSHGSNIFQWKPALAECSGQVHFNIKFSRAPWGANNTPPFPADWNIILQC